MKFLHVPYRGAAPALTDLLGGQSRSGRARCAGDPVANPGRQLKPLAAASDARNPMLPNVPTLAELGYPETNSGNWYALLAPAKTPAPIVAKLNAAVAKALADPDVKNKLVQSGAIPAAGTPEEMAAMLKAEYERWGRIVREKGSRNPDLPIVHRLTLRSSLTAISRERAMCRSGNLPVIEAASSVLPPTADFGLEWNNADVRNYRAGAGRAARRSAVRLLERPVAPH